MIILKKRNRKIVDSVKINAFKEDTVKETQKSAPKSVSRQNDVKPETKTETAKASKEENSRDLQKKNLQRETGKRTERKTGERKTGKSIKTDRNHYRSGRNQRY